MKGSIVLNILSFINKNKRKIVTILGIVIFAISLLPLASAGRIDAGKTKFTNLAVFNVSGNIKKVKDAIGMDTVDLNGIDQKNPIDDIEKTTIALSKITEDTSAAVLLLYLAIICLLIGTMAAYVNPNGIAGIIAFLTVPISLIVAMVKSINAFDSINTNIKLIKDYFGMSQDLIGFEYKISPVLYVLFVVCVINLSVLITFRTPQKSNNEVEKLTKLILLFFTVVSVLSVFFITLFLIIKGVPTISKIGFFNFVFGSIWDPTADNPKFGIFNLILTSLVGTFGAIIIGVPVGIFVAVFISQLSPPKLSIFLNNAFNLLAGIPSVIYGAVGAILLVPFIQKVFSLATGATLFAAIIVLSIMVLPTIISVTTNSLNAVPKTYMEASLALGLTKQASIFKILIPAANAGIMAGVLLGLGRAIGEAMAIILVAGNVPGLPQIFKPARFLTTGIVAEMGYATGLHRDALFAIGLVLFFFILIINSCFRYMIKKFGAKYE